MFGEQLRESKESACIFSNWQPQHKPIQQAQKLKSQSLYQKSKSNTVEFVQELRGKVKQRSMVTGVSRKKWYRSSRT